MSFDCTRMSNFNHGYCIAFKFQGIDVHLIIFAMLFSLVGDYFLLSWCFSLPIVVLARAVSCHVSFTTTGETGLLFGFFSIVVLAFYIQLFIGLRLLFLGGIWVVLFCFPIGSCTSMNGVYSFCHCNNCVDLFFSSILDFNILTES